MPSPRTGWRRSTGRIRNPFPTGLLLSGERSQTCAVRHRAALLLTLYEPPSGAGDQLIRIAQRPPVGIEGAMLETLRSGRSSGYLRGGIDLETLSDRLCQVLLHVSLGVFRDVLGSGSGAGAPLQDHLERDRCGAADRCRAGFVRSRSRRPPRRSIRGRRRNGRRTSDSRCSGRLRGTEFGRRGYEATTVRDIAAAAGMSVGSVYRLIGSKDELLASIMRTFTVKARSGWTSVLRSEGTSVEKLDDVDVDQHQRRCSVQ